MSVLKKVDTDQSGTLFNCANTPEDIGCLACLFPKQPDKEELDLNEALFQLQGMFLFSEEPFPVGSEEETSRFLENLRSVKSVLNKDSHGSFLWLQDTRNIRVENTFVLLMNKSGTGTITSLEFPIGSEEFHLSIGPMNKVQIVGSSLLLKSDEKETVRFTGRKAPEVIDMGQLNIPLVGPQRGCIVMKNLFIKRKSLTDDQSIKVGFQFVQYENKRNTYDQLWFPLLNHVAKRDDSIGFNACFEVLRLFNSADLTLLPSPRTRLIFTGETIPQNIPILETNFITRLGYPIGLIPIINSNQPEYGASLVLQASPRQESGLKDCVFSPAGEFSFEVPKGGMDNTRDIICGLSGTEYIKFRLGDRMKFIPNCYATADSIVEESEEMERTINNPFIKIGKDRLKGPYLTSWVYFLAESGSVPAVPIRYVAQPTGATLYGNVKGEEEIHGRFFRFMDTSMPIISETPFPLVPYEFVQSKPDHLYEKFEKQVLSPVRRGCIASPLRASDEGMPFTPSNQTASCSTNKYQATTPSGLLVALDPDNGTYKKVLLAASAHQEGDSPKDLSFVNLSSSLQQAFQSNQLFLVANSAKHLVGSQSHPESSFCNELTIGDWKFRINVGENGKTGMDYSNIVIVKGTAGPGQSVKDLVKKPEVWTQPDDFVASSFIEDEKLGAIETGDVNLLSKWMTAYIEDTIKLHGEDEDYKHFVRAVTDPYWKGMLVLKATVEFPKSLEGLKFGMEGDGLYAHHIGCETTPIGEQLITPETNALFGLVRYHDPLYLTADHEKSVFVTDHDNDFRVQSLRVMIFNGQLAAFQCKAQLTLDKWFNQPIMSGKPNSPENILLLEGSLQKKNNKYLYVMDTQKETTFRFNSNILDRVLITKATLQTTDENDMLINQFALNGYLSFQTIRQRNQAPIDIFSFGAEESGDGGTNEKPTYTGLCFSNSTVEMKVDREDGKISFDQSAKHVVMDMAMSTPRDASLFRSFSMDLIGFEQGNDNENGGIEKLGFTKVNMKVPVNWDAQENWCAMRFRLNAGTSGALAGNMKLSMELLLAWSPDEGNQTSHYNIYLGIKLAEGQQPISLQGVIKLSFQNAAIHFEQANGVFYLIFHQMALSFLGIKKLPPVGAPSLYLLGSKEPNRPLAWYAHYKG
ncbi:hypothetical protein [Bacillus sp. FSL L8-0152]|uniref:hypothetical protein n=1 Tax=Bacillus sp. FSL L8-0152 TaxID=2921516 RepID=UPI0030F6467E